MLPDQWAAANQKQLLVHCIGEAGQVAKRKRDNHQKRRVKIATTSLGLSDGAGY